MNDARSSNDKSHTVGDLTPNGIASRSPFPPPVAQDTALSQPATDPEVTTTSQSARSRRWPIVIALVATVGFVAAGSWAVLRDNADAAATDAGRMRLPTDPQQRYSVTLGNGVDHIVEAVGSPDRLALKVGWGAANQVLVLDAEGTELWRREIDYWDTIEFVDGDVLLTSQVDDDDNKSLEMTRLDGDSGDERWSTVAPGVSLVGVPAHWVRDSTVLAQYVLGSRIMIAAYDVATGEQIAERELFMTSNGVPGAAGSIVVIDDDELYVVDDRLENIGQGTPSDSVGDPAALALLDGEILTIDGQQLTLFGPDGSVSTAAIDVDGIDRLAGITDSSWLYHTTTNSCGAFGFDGSDVEPFWQKSQDCHLFFGWPVVSYEDGDPLVFPPSDLTDDEVRVLNARTGETVFSSGAAWASPYVNGFVTHRLGDLTAYAWPGGEESFAIRPTNTQLAWLIDDGYVIADEIGDGLLISVYE